MLRPVDGWGWQARALAGGVLCGAFALGGAGLARAAATQQAALGLSAVHSAAPAPAKTPPTRKYAENAHSAFGPEQRAQELYLDGMEKLDAGHPAWAQKAFQTVIDRFPQSAAAGLARRQLRLLGPRRPVAVAPDATTGQPAPTGAAVRQPPVGAGAAAQCSHSEPLTQRDGRPRVFQRRQCRARQPRPRRPYRPGAVAQPLA